MLNRHRVRYVVIGGVACQLFGVDLPRTADLDITPADDLENRKNLAAALEELEALLRAPGLDYGIAITLDEHTFRRASTLTFVTRYGPFDVALRPDGTSGYDDFDARSVVIRDKGVDIPTAHLADVLRSKEAAGREKDATHLAAIRLRLAEIE